MRKSKVGKAPRQSVDLTPMQRRAILAATRAGYYDFPRGVSLSALAKRLRTAPASLSEALRGAERKVIGKFVEEMTSR